MTNFHAFGEGRESNHRRTMPFDVSSHCIRSMGGLVYSANSYGVTSCRMGLEEVGQSGSPGFYPAKEAILTSLSNGE